MNKIFAKLLAALVLVSFASPALAKRAEYNFNTCSYTFSSNVDPFTRQHTTAPANVNINRNMRPNNAGADQLRGSIPVSVYSQTPQRTITLPNPRSRQTQVVNTNNNYQPQQQQRPSGYYYAPGQNTNGQSNSQGVDYQWNSSGAATYSSNSNYTSTQNSTSRSSK